MRRAVSTVAALTALAGFLTGCGARPDGVLGLVTAVPRQIDLHTWDGTSALATGTERGVRVTAGRIAFDRAIGTRTVGGTSYDVATWTGPSRRPGFAYTQLIASWSARTPGDSWLQVQVRGAAAGGSTTAWKTLADWAATDRYLHRTSLGSQAGGGTTVDVDTWKTPGFATYQLRLRLFRRHGTAATPDVDLVTAMTSRLPSTAGPTSAPGPGDGIVLDVPRYSQMIHRGEFPQWGGGGEAWCSPTSTSMVLGYYDRLPAARAYAWVPSSYADPWVDFAARNTFDQRYDGTGNWPFNTAYAAPRAGKAFVTRLRSLREAGRFIAAGIPLVVSIAFGPGELTGSPISASNGHLIVIAGFTRSGDVVVNDPAAATASGVRRTYNRAQFERLWLDASGGTAYVIHDAAHPLPAGTWTNW
ncbi:MAG TPA: peptidase C39 family protein [Nocardioides sp.]|nr:peptidase C39 family protein [Nocardioides sp.]